MHYFQDQFQIWNDSKLSWIEEFQRLRLIFEEILKFRRQQESPRTYCELSKRRVRTASYCYLAENQSGEACPHAFWRGRIANVCLQVIGACYGQLLLWLARPTNFQLKTSPPSPPPPRIIPQAAPQLWQATILFIVKSLAIFFEKTLKISFSFSFLTVPSTSCTLVFPGYRQVPIHAFPSQRGLNPTVL